MPTSLTPCVPSASQRINGSTRAGRTVWIVAGLLAAAAVAVALMFPKPLRGLLVSFAGRGGERSASPYIVRRAESGPFRIVITENGTVGSLRNFTLSNSVEGSTTIISIVPEGSKVLAPTIAEFDGTVQYVDSESQSSKSVKVVGDNGEEKVYQINFGEFTEMLVTDRQRVRKGDYIAGDVVCELDSSTLEEKEKEQQIKVTTAKASLEKARKDIEIQATTNESNVAKARLAEELAQLDLKSYTAEGGEYQQAVETIKGDLKKTEEELSINKEEYERIRDQARLGYANVNQLESARLKVTQSQIVLRVKSGELAVLENFTRVRKESELRQTAEDTVRETARARLEGEALMTQKQAAYDAALLTYQVEQEKLELFRRQIMACRLVAPQAGEVVYASQNNSRGSEPVVIQEGASVRERQAIINLPDLEHMKIDARIHESRISRVVVGQPVEIEVDAIPGEPFRGRLQSISSVPIPGSWPNTDLKEYEAVVEILDGADQMRKLKPGMTAQIRIVVEDRKQNVLQVPVQSVVSFSGRYFTYVMKGKDVERRELKIGDANDEYMEILDGVAEGESVVMSPRTHFSKELSVLEAEIAKSVEAEREKLDTPPRTRAAGPVGDDAATTSRQGPPGSGGPGRPGAGSPGGTRGPGGGMNMDPKAIFDSMDANKDGVVTKEEHPRPEFFDRTDADGNGELTLQEMESALSRFRAGGGGAGGSGRATPDAGADSMKAGARGRGGNPAASPTAPTP